MVPEMVTRRAGHGCQGIGTGGQPNGEGEEIRWVMGSFGWMCPDHSLPKKKGDDDNDIVIVVYKNIINIEY